MIKEIDNYRTDTHMMFFGQLAYAYSLTINAPTQFILAY